MYAYTNIYVDINIVQFKVKTRLTVIYLSANNKALFLQLVSKLRLYNNDILVSLWVGPDGKNSDQYIVQVNMRPCVVELETKVTRRFPKISQSLTLKTLFRH